MNPAHLERVYPIRSYISQRGDEGYAFACWNTHTASWEPAGFWHETYAQAATDRAEHAQLLSMEAA